MKPAYVTQKCQYDLYYPDAMYHYIKVILEQVWLNHHFRVNLPHVQIFACGSARTLAADMCQKPSCYPLFKIALLRNLKSSHFTEDKANF